MTYTGTQKAAVLLLTLQPDDAATVLKFLPHDVVDSIVTTIANTKTIPSNDVENIIDEAMTLMATWKELIEGGMDAAQKILERAYGPSRAQEMLQRLTAVLRTNRPFLRLAQTDISQLLQLLSTEHPQTIALILSYTDAILAAKILKGLPSTHAAEVTRRMTQQQKVSPEIITALEHMLESKLVLNTNHESSGSVDHVVPILNQLEAQAEKEILEALALTDPELVESIRTKLFTFDDLISLDDNAIRTILKLVDTKNLALAVKAASSEVTEKLKQNLSEHAQEILNDELSVLNRVRMHDAEKAQHDILTLVHKLEEEGQIVIPHGESESYVS